MMFKCYGTRWWRGYLVVFQTLIPQPHRYCAGEGGEWGSNECVRNGFHGVAEFELRR